MCPRDINKLFVAGEEIRKTTRGMYFLNTLAEAPFAMGRSSSNRFRQQPNDFMVPGKRRDPLLEEIDQWGKLDGSFNNIDQFPTPLPQDPMHDQDDEWNYFGHRGPSQITNNYYYSGDNNNHNNRGFEEAEDENGPFGIQVLDVLHRNKEQPQLQQLPPPTNSHSNNNNNNYNSRRPQMPHNKNRVRTRTGNTPPPPDQTHLIEKLWEDYNSVENNRRDVSPAVQLPYWRRRQVYNSNSNNNMNNNDGDQFFSLPSMKVLQTETATAVAVAKKVKEEAKDVDGDMDQMNVKDVIVPVSRQILRPGH